MWCYVCEEDANEFATGTGLYICETCDSQIGIDAETFDLAVSSYRRNAGNRDGDVIQFVKNPALI